MLAEPLHFARGSVVVVDVGAIDAQLSGDGEVTILGHVAHYLASWRTRATAGEVAPAWTFRYHVVGRRLEFPVTADEADHVAAVFAEILSRPGMTEPMTEPVQCPRRNKRKPTRR